MAKKKGKKGATSDGSEIDAGQTAQKLQAEMRAMARELAFRKQEALRAQREKREIEARFAELRDDFKETADGTEAITLDMTRQYKAMEERFMDDINRLEAEVMSLKDELAEERSKFEELKRERDADVAAKEEEIAALKKKMEEMADEFAAMLQETLRLMSDKIEVGPARWEGDSSVPVVTRATEFEPTGAGASAGGGGTESG